MTATAPNRHARVESPRSRRQRGATTLIVVMVLFFVAALAAAYASRNLIFEQRTSANQYRSTQSLEAAEAGLEWALALLNGGNIDAACQPTANTAFTNFRQRMLDINASTGQVSPRFKNGGNFDAGFLWAGCSQADGNWQCTCPTGDLGALPAGSEAFGVRLEFENARPGLTRIEVNGCNSTDTACLTAEATTSGQKCNSTLCALAMLHPGVKAAPVAALTARSSVLGTLQVYNQDASAGGVTVQSGGLPNPALLLFTVSGSPVENSVRWNDTTLPGLDLDAADCVNCIFAKVFGLQPRAYIGQPSLLQMDCSGGCTAAGVNAKLASNRSRMVYLAGAGGLTVANSTDVIGSATDPVVLVVDGPVTLEASATASPGSLAQIFGLVYARGLPGPPAAEGLATVKGGRIRGALISTGTVVGDTGAGAMGGQVVFDSDVLNRLRLATGSFVRVPGSWRDFQ